MATIVKRPSGRWQARVRRFGGQPTSRTFATRTSAEAWARGEESDIDRGVWRDRSLADRTSLEQLLKRYIVEVIAGRKSEIPDTYRVKRLIEDMGHLRLSALTAQVVAEWRDQRLKAVAPSTVARELTTLSGAITWARKELMIPLVEHPVAAIRRPAQGKARDRRLMEDEERWLLDALESSPEPIQGAKRSGNYRTGSHNTWVRPLVQLALETAMRQGELVSLRWEHVNLAHQTAYLPDTKNGTDRTVPLSTKAIALLRSLPRSIDGRVFPISTDATKRAWSRSVKRARKRYEAQCSSHGREPTPGFLTDLHFHDLRHEATSRLAEKLPNLIELASVTGHKDLRMLKRYYHPRAIDLAKKLG